MGLIQKIHRHAAIAGGNFDGMFKDIEIPPLPTAINRLFHEINKPDPDINRLVQLISSETGLAAKVIKTVNSALYSLPMPVADIKRAVTVLGFNNIRSMTLAYATIEAIPKPDGNLFDHEAFWTDSLLRAFMSRTFAETQCVGQAEEAFTVSLLADVALPVLLSSWAEYYESVIYKWRRSSKRLSEIEREQFGWDHAQAGAWIVQSWGFPTETVCFLGAHTLPIHTLKKHELRDTIIIPIAIAARSPSVLRDGPEKPQLLYKYATDYLSISGQNYIDKIKTIQKYFEEILSLFNLNNQRSDKIFTYLLEAASKKKQGPE